MKIHFFKYQATGNDFVMIDNRSQSIALTNDQIVQICDRKFGVGADGLMLLEPHAQDDFNLVYYNSDGTQSLCGNGSRAAVHLAAALGMIGQKTTFRAYDGSHQGELAHGVVKVKMGDVWGVKSFGNDVFIHTGSPHLIRLVTELKDYPVVDEGRKIRYSEPFKPGGTNANFVELQPNNTLFVRTYERGVENETLSCGTGVTAAALAASFHGYTSPVTIVTKGGSLSVEFKTGHLGSSQTPGQRAEASFYDIFLVGPAKMVFEGDLEL